MPPEEQASNDEQVDSNAEPLHSWNKEQPHEGAEEQQDAASQSPQNGYQEDFPRDHS